MSVITSLASAIRSVQRPNDTITPPVPALLVLNRVPTDAEAQLIRSSVTTANLEIERIQRSQVISSIFARRINIYKNFIRVQSALLVRQFLPPVVLKKIFLFTEGDEKPLSEPNKPPWILGQVCRQWRAIALGTPNLWWNLPPVRLGRLTQRDVDRIHASLSELLDRCSGGRISFFLHNEVANPMEYPIIDLLVAHCRQWEHISLKMSGITFANLRGIEGQLDSLHSLEFSLRERGEPILKLFESAPRLRAVRVNHLVSSVMLRLPWMQLTSYEDRTAFGDVVSEALCSASRMQHLRFIPNADEKLTSWPQVHWMPIIMPYLTTLTIEFWDKRYNINSLFDNLTLPALHTLVLRFSENDDVMGVELVKMITRSLCLLRHLTFYGRDSLIKEFLPAMPALTSLHINDPDPKLIEKLSQFRGSEWKVVPQLRTLTVHLSKSYEHSYLATLSRLGGIRCDTLSVFRDERTSLPMLKTFKIAIHGTPANHCLSHFYYASLEPPRTEIELQSGDGIAEIFRDRSIWHPRHISSLMNSVKSDPQAVAAIYLSGIDYYMCRALREDPRALHIEKLRTALIGHTKASRARVSLLSRFHREVAEWRLKLTTITSLLKWDWDDDGYLVYIPYEERHSRVTPEFKSQRWNHDIPLDQLPAAKNFCLQESLAEPWCNIIRRRDVEEVRPDINVPGRGDG